MNAEQVVAELEARRGGMLMQPRRANLIAKLKHESGKTRLALVTALASGKILDITDAEIAAARVKP